MNISKDHYEAELVQMGEALRAARQKAGLTMKEAGEKIGVQESTVSKIERGAWNCSAAFLIALAKQYGLKWALTK